MTRNEVDKNMKKFLLLAILPFLFAACNGHEHHGGPVHWIAEVTPGEEKPSITLPIVGDDYEAAIPYSRVVLTVELPRKAKGGYRRVFTLSSVGEQKVRQEVACSTAGEAGSVGGEATLTLEGATARFYCQL